MDCVSASAQVGISKDFVGFDAGASLVTVGTEIEVPILFTDKKISAGVEGKLFSIGYTAGYDYKEKNLK